mmetsp:Transcript_71921/g.166473  ORF Transcript_71921/g.166473 Transcript_71921/m.166473 type:complete len:210 (+) Transcript_71921:323-952(+)
MPVQMDSTRDNAPGAPVAFAAPSGLGHVPGSLAPAGLAATSLATQGSTTPEQMAEYARYVAALQLQYAAMGTMAAAQPSVSAPCLMASRERSGPVVSHDPIRRFTGSVFKWDDDQGWGFISCLDARKVYGKDVFLHKAEIGGVADLYRQRTKVEVKNGDWVAFSVEMSRGKPRARDVEKVETPEEYRRPGEAKRAEDLEQATKKRRVEE